MSERDSLVPESDPIEPDHDAIAIRAYSVSWLPDAWSEAENWERARLELREERELIARRAADISRTRPSGDAVDDWLLAERELNVELSMRRLHRTKTAWVVGSARAKAREQDRIARRARQISESANAGSDYENWLRAEREVNAEHRLIAERAGQSWVGTPRWLAAERELIAEGVIPLSYDR